MKKKLLVPVLCILMMLIGGFATWAYLTSQDSVVNTFTVGNVKITLDEKDVDNDTKTEDNVTVDGVVRDHANKYKLIPGGTYEKDPTVHVAAGSETCWVYVTVEISPEFAAIESEEAGKSIVSQMAAIGWSRVTNDEAGNTVYAYKEPVTAGNDAIVFETITVDGEKADNTNISAINQQTMIKVTAYAIQKAGFADAATAWENAKGQF